MRAPDGANKKHRVLVRGYRIILVYTQNNDIASCTECLLMQSFILYVQLSIFTLSLSSLMFLFKKVKPDFTFFLFQVDAQPSVIACEQELTVPGHSSLAFSDPELQVVIRMKI